MAGPALKLSDLFTFRPGVFLQLWANFTQDAFKQANGDSGAFTKNFYARRARFFIGGTIGANLTYFMLWETANLGAPAPVVGAMGPTGASDKQLTTFAFNDAYVDLKLSPMFSIQAGLMLIPFTRNILQSTSTYWTLDIGGVSATYIFATQTSTLRDLGVAFKVNAVDNHLELRGMVSEGVRLADLGPSAAMPPTGVGRGAGKNDPRFSAYAQYNFLDPDTGYVFNGQYFGRKKIAGIGVGADYQSLTENAYFATSATLFAAIPLKGPDPKNGGDEVGGQIEYLHFHGGRPALPNPLLPAPGPQPGLPVTATPIPGVGKQDALLIEAGYYNKASKFSVFGKFEGRFYKEDNQKLANQRVYAVGAKYFLAEQIANLTLMYSLTQTPDRPDNAIRNDVNAIQLQLQVGYF